jgi:hypothetical protein
LLVKALGGGWGAGQDMASSTALAPSRNITTATAPDGPMQ